MFEYFTSYIKITFCLICFCMVFELKAQGYSNEIGILSENDSYMMGSKDGYYTNGLNVSYRWGKNDVSNTLSVGQQMYNAKNGGYDELKEIDRPVTAYLYINYTRSFFVQKDNLLQWSVSLGAIGEMAYGEEMQKLIHEQFRMYKPKAWDFQLGDAIGVNGSLLWAKEFPLKNKYELQLIAKVNAGLFFNDIEISPLFRVGKYNRNNETMLWNNRKGGNNRSKNELFFFFSPSIVASMYNVTVQGNMFKKNKGVFVSDINHFLYKYKIGFYGSFNRLGVKLSINYTTKEAVTQIRDQWYASIGLQYLLK